MTSLVLVAVALVAAFVGAVVAARLRWRARSSAEWRRLLAAVQPAALRGAPARFAELPPPVAGYLALAVPANAKPIRTATLVSRGTFRVGEGERDWRPFRAEQVFSVAPPAFVWDARIALAPGMEALVRDALIDGVGSMRGAIHGLVPLVDARSSPELTCGALHRLLGELAWLPTALGPGGAVTWRAVDDATAIAEMAIPPCRVSLEFRFGADGLPESLSTDARFRDVRGHALPTPWHVTLSRFESRGGYLIPIEAEVAWRFSSGRFPYWRGEIVAARFE